MRPGDDDRAAVVGEAGGSCFRELGHLGQLGPRLGLRDRGEEPDRDLGLGPRLLDERGQDGSRVDDRLRVGHCQDGAVAAGRGRSRARGDRLLVLAARRPEVHVRVDERGREHQPGAVDDAVVVRVEPGADLRDHAAVDAHVDDVVDSLSRVENARAPDDEALSRGVLDEQHQATSIAASDSTATGPWVSRS